MSPESSHFFSRFKTKLRTLLRVHQFGASGSDGGRRQATGEGVPGGMLDPVDWMLTTGWLGISAFRGRPAACILDHDFHGSLEV